MFHFPWVLDAFPMVHYLVLFLRVRLLNPSNHFFFLLDSPAAFQRCSKKQRRTKGLSSGAALSQQKKLSKKKKKNLNFNFRSRFLRPPPQKQTHKKRKKIPEKKNNIFIRCPIMQAHTNKHNGKCESRWTLLTFFFPFCSIILCSLVFREV